MGVRLSEFELYVMTHFWADRELSAPGFRAHRRRTRRGLLHREDDRGPARGKGRDRARREPGPHDRLFARDQAGAPGKPLVKAFLRRLFGDDLRPLCSRSCCKTRS